MGTPLCLLIVEDSADDALLITRALRREGYDLAVKRVETATTMKATLAEQTWDVVIADYAMPSFSGLAALQVLQETGLDLPFILVSGTIGEDIAVSAMKAGAHDYVIKDNLARLGPAIRRELQEAQSRRARRRAEQSLRESESRFRTMAESIEDGLTIIEHGEIVYANRRVCEIFGYPLQEYVAMTLPDFVLPGERERVSRFLERIGREHDARQEAEFWILRKDGTLCCIRNRYSASREEDQLIGHYVVTTDITDRIEAEREVEERRQYLERVLAAAPDAIVTLDADYKIAEWNSGAEHVFGYSREEAIGQTLDRLITTADTLEAARAYTEQVMKGKDLPPIEVVRYRKDGSPVDLIAAGSPIQVGDSVIGSVAVYTDISPRKRAERLLRGLNNAALAVETVLDPSDIFTTVGEQLEKLGFLSAILLLDKDGQRLVPKYFNYGAKAVALAEKLLGVNAETYSVAVDKVDVFRKVIRDGCTVLATGEDGLRQVLPSRLKGLAGQIVKILDVARSIDAPLIVEDEVVGLLSVQSDDLVEEDMPAVSAFAHQIAAAWRKARLMQDLERSLQELQTAQTQLIQAQKMEALGRLAGGIAHDFNNLLTIIDISGRLLERQLHPQDPLWEHVQRIREASERAANLTKQLLSFSRREVVRLQSVDLNEVVGDLGRMLQRIIGEDVQLVTKLAKSLAPIEADPAQIEQVIVNLAVNARDAMPTGGRLYIETVNTVLDETYAASHVEAEPGEYVMLAVSDTGVGMSDEVKAHLFEPFFTTKARGQGTGLGLPTVFGIVKGSGGHIRVHSQEGLGTCFYLYFPVTQESATPAKRPTVSGATLRGTETILVVEDEASVRDLAVQILKSHGYKVLAAEDGQGALRLSGEYDAPIHLLFTDVVMPEMNGKILAQKLQSQRQDLRVLYMSGYSEDIIAHHGGLGEGAIVLTKPFTLEALVHRVRLALDPPG